MRLLTLLSLLPACTWISAREWAEAADRDGDGSIATEAGGDDCDDADAAVHPGAEETCDDRDEDCDGAVDDGLPTSTWFPDADGDGHGVAADPLEACAAPAGYAADDDDCDDQDAAVHPEATERLDGLDQDCDAVADDLTLPASATWTLWGDAGHDRAGESSQAGADLSGDGHADLLAAVPGAGLVGVWWGGDLALAGVDDAATWQPDLLLKGDPAGEHLRILAGVGDPTGGGVALVLTTEVGGEPSCHLFLGDLPAAGEVPLADADVALTGCGGGGPAQIAWGGDLDGDDLDDLPFLPAETSDLFLLAGREAQHWNRLDGNDATAEAEFTLRAAADPGRLVARLEGDLDGDGLDDLLVAEPDLDGAGALAVLYGAEDLLAGGVALDLPSSDAWFAGSAADGRLGDALTATADLTGDGRADLLIGVPGLGRVLVLAPGTDRWAGALDPDAAALAAWDGPTGAGAGLSAGPDLDGDSGPDVLVAADATAARAWLICDPTEPGSATLDERAAATVVGLTDPSGSRLAADLDDDGDGELLLTDPADPARAVEGGALHLVLADF